MRFLKLFNAFEDRVHSDFAIYNMSIKNDILIGTQKVI